MRKEKLRLHRICLKDDSNILIHNLSLRIMEGDVTCIYCPDVRMRRALRDFFKGKEKGSSKNTSV